MSLEDWLRDGRLRPHRANRQEIVGILHIVDRDMSDAVIQNVSPDRRFATAYNAILQLATAVIRASGYRVAGQDHHWLTLHVLSEIMPSLEQDQADYFDGCRRKRNKVDYDSADVISEREVEEVVQETEAFRLRVVKWLKDKHPTLAP